MRRPALYHPTSSAALSAWAHPYPTGLFNPVFYNTPPAPAAAPAPSPADLAARNAPPAVPAAPAPATPPAPGDDEEKVTVTQRRLNVLMKNEKEEGKRSALRALAEAAGVDPETFDPDTFGAMVKQAEETRQAQLSEEQRRTEELAQKTRDLEAREQATKDREAAVAKRDRESLMRAELVKLGATDEDLVDATELLRSRVAEDADLAAITEAAGKLKERRAELFGGVTVAQTALPPAPGGAPAGGPPPRTPAGGKDAVQQKARKLAEDMGLRKPEAA